MDNQSPGWAARLAFARASRRASSLSIGVTAETTLSMMDMEISCL
jgi:hypothetical protein